MNHVRLAAAVLLALFLCACGGSRYDLEAMTRDKAVHGATADGGVTVSGTLGPGHPGRDSLSIFFRSPDGSLKCSGKLSSAMVNDGDDCNGLSGHNYLDCGAGYPVLLQWEAWDCASGMGFIELPGGRKLSLSYGFASLPEAAAAFASDKKNVRSSTESGANKIVGAMRTGFFVSDNGIFVTDITGFEKSRVIQAIFPSEKGVVNAKILSVDHRSGLAVAKVDRPSKGLPINDVVADPGDQGLIMGYLMPAGQDIQLRARSATIQAQRDKNLAKNLLRLNVPIERAYAGGPLLNARGEVMGIATLKSSTDAESHVVRTDVLKGILAAIPGYRPARAEPLNEPDFKAMPRLRKDSLIIVRLRH